MDDKDPDITIKDLPIKFTVKYLGSMPTKGLWGMKYTRKPVDTLVAAAKSLPPDRILPLVRLEVTREGLSFRELSPRSSKKSNPLADTHFPVESISYGVQDLVYTRVFSMIYVSEGQVNESSPFQCHSYVCESRHQARHITYALAAAFQEFGKKVKNGKIKKFAIDLRTPEQQAKANEGEPEEEETEA